MDVQLAKSRKMLLLVGMLALIITLQTIFYRNENVDPYAFSTIGNAQQMLNNGHYQINPFSQVSSSWQEHANGISERPAPSMLITIFSLVTGLSIWNISFLPIIGLIFLLLFFVFARIFSGSTWFATICVAVMSFDSLINETTSNVYYISYGFTLVMLFLLVYAVMLRAKTHNRIYFMLFLLIFIVSYFSYYTAEFLMIGFVFCFELILFMLKRPRTKMMTLPLIFMTIFITFDSVFSSYISWKPWGKGLSYFESIVYYFIGFVFRGSVVVKERGHFLGSLTSVYLEFVLRVLILVPVAAYVGYSALRKLRSWEGRQKLGFSIRATIFVSLILVVIAGMAVYINLGVVDYRGFYIFFPLLAIMSIDSLGHYFSSKKNRRILVALLVLFSFLLLSVSVSRFVIGTSPLLSSEGSFSMMMPSTNWTCEHLNSDAIVTNFHSAGLLFFSAVESNKGSNITVFFLQFANVVSFLTTSNVTNASNYFSRMGYGYLLIPTDMQHSITDLGAWAIVGRVPPLGGSTFTFDNFPTFIKIYDDGRGILYLYEGERP